MAKLNLKYLAAFGICLCVVVVVLGAFTRLVDAGLGCPDWPGCYGHLLWPDEHHEIEKAELAFPDAPVDLDKTWPEMVHRYFAGTLMLTVLLINFVAWRREEEQTHKTLTSVMLVLIICQAAFGAWTVTLKLWPQVVTAHLLGGFATLSMLWLLFLRCGGFADLSLLSEQRIRISAHARLAFALVIVQIALGGWVSSNYAALACADFPTCFGSYNPPMDLSSGFNVLQGIGPNYLGGLLDGEARVAIHWMHRLGAVLVLLMVGALSFRLFSMNKLLASLVGGVLALQLVLGSLNVVWSLPLAVATAHNAVGALLLLLMVAVNFAPLQDRLLR